jgi:hypothetical protein
MRRAMMMTIARFGKLLNVCTVVMSGEKLVLEAIKKAPAAAYFPHPVARAVSWALKRFTSVFGMGTGGATSL